MQFMEPTVRLSPFGCVRWAIEGGQLGRLLRKHKLGQYKRINKAFRAAVNLDLGNISIDLLETVPGLGMKTARMTMLYYEPDAECVPLDTHLLKFLRARGYDAPKSTPGSRNKYLELEKAFVAEAKKRGKSVRELDTEVWQHYAKA
jgi:thermostable 8-oxoguanine DNA glycosylase